MDDVGIVKGMYTKHTSIAGITQVIQAVDTIRSQSDGWMTILKKEIVKPAGV